jgi:integrase
MGVFKKYTDKKGNKTGPWYVQYPVERLACGKIRYKTVRASWNKKKAMKLLRKKQDEFVARDRFGVVDLSEMTFSELMHWGLKQEVMKSKASASDDATRAGHLKAHFGGYLAAHITPLMVDNFRKVMRQTVSKSTKKPYSGATVNKTVSLARRIYYLAMDEGLVTANPFARRKAYPEPPKGRYIPDEDFRALHANFPDYVKPFVLVGYLTGMRRGEILELEWGRVNLFKSFIDLTEEDVKTDMPRRIYFDSVPELKRVFIEAARSRKPDQSLVFTKPDGNPVPKWYIQRLFKKACAEAGVGPYRLHDLRHTFNTNMSKAGVKDAVVMKLTGHKTLAMFLRYSHLDREQGEDAMQRLNDYLHGNEQDEPKKEEQET